MSPQTVSHSQTSHDRRASCDDDEDNAAAVVVADDDDDDGYDGDDDKRPWRVCVAKYAYHKRLGTLTPSYGNQEKPHCIAFERAIDRPSIQLKQPTSGDNPANLSAERYQRKVVATVVVIHLIKGVVEMLFGGGGDTI